MQNKGHYIITGGAGFIGSHLADSLIEGGHRVSIIDDLSTGKREYINQQANFIEADISTYQNWDSLFNDAIGCFHLAAVASVTKCTENRLLAHQTNVSGTLNIFEAALSAEVPVVFASSSAVYGNNPALPLHETEMPMPTSIYAADKLTAETYGKIFHTNYGLPITCLRFFNVYGPRQPMHRNLDSGVIANFYHLMRDDKQVTIYGDGEQTRDFIFVADVVRALRLCMEQQQKTAQIYNICTGERCSINYMLELLSKLMSVNPDINYQPAHVADVKHSLGSPDLIEKMLGFKANFDLAAGLGALINNNKLSTHKKN